MSEKRLSQSSSRKLALSRRGENYGKTTPRELRQSSCASSLGFGALAHFFVSLLQSSSTREGERAREGGDKVTRKRKREGSSTKKKTRVAGKKGQALRNGRPSGVVVVDEKWSKKRLTGR